MSSPSESRARAIISAFSDILVQTLEQLHLPTYLLPYVLIIIGTI